MLKRFSKKTDTEQPQESVSKKVNRFKKYAESYQKNTSHDCFEKTPSEFSNDIHKNPEMFEPEDKHFRHDFHNEFIEDCKPVFKQHHPDHIDCHDRFDKPDFKPDFRPDCHDRFDKPDFKLERPNCNDKPDFDVPNGPGLFLGGKRIDLKHHEIKKEMHEILEIVKYWITGNKDGDISNAGYLPADERGIDIYTEGKLVDNYIDEIDLSGEYVQVRINEDGRVGIYIGRPVGSSHFNSTNSVTDGTVVHDITLIDMIVPSVAGISNHNIRNMYGDWEPGKVVKGFNANPDLNEKYETKCHNKCDYSQFITFTTKESINLNSLNTFFIINVYNGFGTKIVSVKTQDIIGNSESLALIGNNKHVYVQIEDFTEYKKDAAYSIKPTFIIDIGSILEVYGGRFSVEIIHINDLLELTYNSGEIFFNRGKLPRITSFEAYALIKDIEHSTEFCSGLRYIKPNYGFIRYILTRN